MTFITKNKPQPRPLVITFEQRAADLQRYNWERTKRRILQEEQWYDRLTQSNKKGIIDLTPL